MSNPFLFLVRLVLLFCFSFSLMAQEVLDNVQYRAVYNFSYKTKPDQTEFAKTDLMYLDIGEKATKFYSRNESLKDSIRNDALKKGLSSFEIVELTRGYPAGTRTVYYNFLNERKRLEASNFSYLFAYYEEEMLLPNWQLENEIVNIEGFNCHKATTTYLGRDWIVYFTQEIPINLGPWKLWGLPGLIVKATDSEENFKFVLNGFEKIDNNTPLILTLKSQSGKEYSKVNKIGYRKMEKMFYTDNNEFMNIYLGVKNITITRADGTQWKGRLSIPFIPLELE